jgi:hypothetical protein
VRKDKDNREGNGSHPPVEYRYPYITEDALAQVYIAYQALTGRKVFDRVRLLLILNARFHGPDLIPLMKDLYAQHGVDDLLKRLLDHPPRLTSPGQDASDATSAGGTSATSASETCPRDATLSRAQEVAWRVAEFRPQHDDGLRPREWKARLDQTFAKPDECPSCGDRHDREPGGWCDLCQAAGRIVMGTARPQ